MKETPSVNYIVNNTIRQQELGKIIDKVNGSSVEGIEKALQKRKSIY
jgi:predicted transcriptional regulator